MWGFQDIMVYLIGLAAIVYLIKKLFFKKKQAGNSCGEGECNCH